MSSPFMEQISGLIRKVLLAPSVVPSQVSSKTVRKTLIDEYQVDKEELSNHKEAVKQLILTIFRELYPDEAGGDAVDEDATMRDVKSATATPMKKQYQHLTVSQASGAPSSPAVPIAEDAGKKRKRDVNDEEYAKQLAQSFEGRSTRGSTSGSTKRKKAGGGEGGKAKKSRVISKATVDDDDDSDSAAISGSEAGKGKKAKASKAGNEGGAKGGFSKPMILSPELAEVLESSTMSRPQVVKQLWVYIKNHQLQKEQNKRVIVCDEKLQKVFKVPEIDMFQMNKVLSSHLRTADE